MLCFWRTSDIAVLLIWGVFVAGLNCTGENQITQNNSSSPVTQAHTTESVQLGTKALLCCPSIPLTKAVLITWIITPRGQHSCIIAYKIETKETNDTCLDRSITWASTPDLSPDLQISAVTLQHEGNYSCEIVTPEGNFHKMYNLQVLVPPEGTLFPGKNRTAVCEAVAGKPAAQISWIPDGDCVTKCESHSNGTVTVRSTCHWEEHNVSAVSCLVSHSTGNQSLSIELSRREHANCQNQKLLQLLRRMKCSLMLAIQRRAIHSMTL